MEKVKIAIEKTKTAIRKKRILSLHLLLALVLPIVSCGAPNDQTSNTTADTKSQTEAESTFFPDIEKSDYKREEFHMIGYPEVGEWYYAEKTNGGVINDAVFAMNHMFM